MLGAIHRSAFYQMSASIYSIFLIACLAASTLPWPANSTIVLATVCEATLNPLPAGSGKILITSGHYQCLGACACHACINGLIRTDCRLSGRPVRHHHRPRDLREHHRRHLAKHGRAAWSRASHTAPHRPRIRPSTAAHTCNSTSGQSVSATPTASAL